jgi:FkbM family methyltransferase
MSLLRLLFHAIPTCAKGVIGKGIAWCQPKRQTYFGSVFEFHPDDVVLRSMVFFGAFETKEAKLFFAALTHGAVVIDVGANIGLYAVPSAKRGARVHALEPDPRTRSILESNIQLNQTEVTTYGMAAGEHRSTGELQHDALNGGHITLTTGQGGSAGSIPIVPLDELFSGLNRLDAIKVDIEGHELAALKGARSLISRHKPRIMIEVFPRLLQERGATADCIFNELTHHGYMLFDENGEKILRIADAIPPNGYANVIALHPNHHSPEAYFAVLA